MTRSLTVSAVERFSIHWLEVGPDIATGEIILGSHRETFEAPLSCWRPEQYQAQWRAAMKELEAGASRAYLLTSAPDPASANFLGWWLLYRVGGRFAVRNGILLLEDLPRPVDPLALHPYIPVRRKRNEDGDEISEWQVAAPLVLAFAGLGKDRT